MNSKKAVTKLFALAAATLAAVPVVPVKVEAQQVQRPPQFVLLAFDGSYNHNFWEASRAFAREMTTQRRPVKFTYFISGVYYTGRKTIDSRTGRPSFQSYAAPGHGVGKSAIGWGEDANDLLVRYDHTNAAFAEGHEIASHANSHYDGSRWTKEQWDYEFGMFNQMIFNFMSMNSLTPTRSYPNGWLFKVRDVTGFRAPLLGYNDNLWPVMKKYGYRYDTSKQSAPDYWPEKHADGGHWNFPLARLTIAGTGKRTLSMDYNFYVADSNAKPDPTNAKRYEEQMYQTYIRYFQNNYNGNRAPVHIGHHFSLWNGGAYWNAMKRFASQVCGLPEVRCATYAELADFMDSKDATTIAAYRRGAFSRVAPIVLASHDFDATYDADIQMAVSRDGSLKTTIKGDDAQLILASAATGEAKIEYLINGTKIKSKLALPLVRSRTPLGKAAEIQVRVLKHNREILRRTHLLYGVGTNHETFAEEALEDRALKGDLPEAHLDELDHTPVDDDTLLRPPKPFEFGV
jgi:peptidoglycan/xylan/chitin deacetylase (PgdA/CDA1 family)